MAAPAPQGPAAAKGGPPQHRINFPPFPKLLPGEMLPTFEEFLKNKTPHGIRVPMSDDVLDDDDYVERDSHGIPTIELLKKHDTDEPRKKKRKANAAPPVGVQLPPDPEDYLSGRKKFGWEEEWEKSEAWKVNTYDPSVHPIDRLHDAANDFRNARSWGPGKSASINGPLVTAWNNFQLYVGLIQQVVPQTLNPNKKRSKTDLSDDDLSDDEDGGMDVPEVSISINANAYAPRAPQRKKKKPNAYDSEFDEKTLKSMTLREKLTLRKDNKDEKTQAFFHDPEKNLKIFFSSHFRERGLLWSERRCIEIPILVTFFLSYLIRSFVFPEPDFKEPLLKALEVSRTAKLELPHTFKLSRADDKFSEGCIALWGSRRDAGAWELTPEVIEEAKIEEVVDDESSKDTSTGESAAGRDTKRRRVGNVEDTDQRVPMAALVDVTAPPAMTGGWGTASSTGGGWGASVVDVDSNADTGAGGWGSTLMDVDAPVWNNGDTEDLEGTAAKEATWNSATATLFSFLGPSALPLTHETGIVENSTRRIVDVLPPLDAVNAKKGKTNASDAEAVEEELERTLARVVLAPWLDRGAKISQDSDILPPTILGSSRGAVISDDEKEGAFDPYKDELVLLVQKDVEEVMKKAKGMGIGAIWVEIARVGEDVKKRSERRRLAYMEQMVHVLPSFHLDADPEE